jgi:RHS repeat-associated protein
MLSVQPLAELGLDLVRESDPRRFPRWDPRLWQSTLEELQCAPSRSSSRFRAHGLRWAKHHLEQHQDTTTQQFETTRPSHGRPEAAREAAPYIEAAEDGRKGGGQARAGSARSAHRQATTRVFTDVAATERLPSTRARAEQAEGGHSHKYDNRRRVRNVTTFRGEPPLWSSPPADYQPPPAPSGTTSFQLLLQDEDFTYDVVNNPTEIRDWRIADEWPAGAKPVTRKIQYDDLYRVTRVDHEYSTGDDAWTSPFAAELGGSSDPRRAEPSPHVGFDKRLLWQSFAYDWLGNTAKTDDDARGFYDRSLGSIVNDTAGEKPYQLRSANNDAFGGTRTGAVGARYDSAGNLTRLDVRRNGPCLGSAECSQRFDYRWDEVGRLERARRWDVAASAITVPEAELPDDAEVDADLEYVYDASDERVIKTAHAGADSVHTVYVLDSLELRRAGFEGADYTETVGTGPGLVETEVPYLFAHGVRLARVVYEQSGDGEPRLESSGQQHVFFELGDHLGSTSVVLDKATSELVERGTWQPFGAKESDYRPERWKGFREDYGFTGKEEDVEVGLQYFGKRFLSPYLGRWVSADPLTVHTYGGDFNLYAYVRGAVLKNVDPLGLQDKNTGTDTQGGNDANATGERLGPQQEAAAQAAGKHNAEIDAITVQETKEAFARATDRLISWGPDADRRTAAQRYADFNREVAEIVETAEASKVAIPTDSAGRKTYDAAYSERFSAARDEQIREAAAATIPGPGGRGKVGIGPRGPAPRAQVKSPPGTTRWKPGPTDLDWRGSGRGVGEALNEAFTRTGVPRHQFRVTRWGKNAEGKSFPVEWRAKGGAEVNIDIGHASDGPSAPHVGFQTPGKRSAGAVRGHILLDHVPVNR